MMVFDNSSYETLLYMKALDNLDEGLIIVYADGRILYVNPAYTDILKVKASKVVGRYIQNVEPDSALRGILEVPHIPIVQQDRLIRSLNKHVSININPIYANDRFIGAVSVFTDMTAVSELSEEIKRVSGIAEEYSRQIQKHTSLKANKVIGKSRIFKDAVNRALTVAPTDVAVLIEGESGSGKAVFAKFLHESSARADAPFITLNCSSIPGNLIESEIFGYKNTAFSGNDKRSRIGKLELAKGGTLVLDEVSELPLEVQAKLLRVLQEHVSEDVSPYNIKPCDVRIITTTNRSLRDLVEMGAFRQDLYYKLNVVSIKIPPLRKRGSDVLLLADYFFKLYSKKYKKEMDIDESVYRYFSAYSWPGNIRELSSIIERTVVLSNGKKVYEEDFRENLASYNCGVISSSLPVNMGTDLSTATRMFEYSYIRQTIDGFDGNKERAAKALGISRRTLYRKLSDCNPEQYEP